MCQSAKYSVPIGERGATTEFRTGSNAIQRSKNGRADIVAKC
jgi:hypothetical protein